MAVLRQYAPSWLVQLPALLPPAEWEALQRTVGPAAPPRMLRELTDALDAFTTEYPLVLVLEDLHWSDRATLAWLAYVARRPDPARLLLLGTYRPVEAMVHDHPLRAVLTELRQHGQCVELALDYLSEAEVTAYLAQRFGSTRLAAELARVLHQRTGGNPLFLIAVVDELVRQQVVTEGPDGWDVRAGVDTITAIIPAHLRALIEHQLAQLQSRGPDSSSKPRVWPGSSLRPRRWRRASSALTRRLRRGARRWPTRASFSRPVATRHGPMAR